MSILRSIVLFFGVLLFCLPHSAFAQTWARTYGGANDDRARSVQQTTDGGFVVAGKTPSFGAGFDDAWVLKLDASGNVQWQKTYGSGLGETAYSIQQAADGGFVVAGATNSFGAGQNDFWVLKLDASGNVQWQKTYGGTDWDEAWSIQQTSDGGYVVAGPARSYGAGNSDFWVLKLDTSGNVQWQKTYGGVDNDYAYSIQQTTDGGYVVAGRTWSFGAGGFDFWVLKLDASGNVAWQNTYGGAGSEYDPVIELTSDGGFILTGQGTSFGAGSWDFWVLKLDASGNITWQKTYGGALSDVAWSIQQTTDGGFAVAGMTQSFGAGDPDFWVLKLDASGNVTWQKTYGDVFDEFAYSIQQTTYGGYIVAGYTWSFGAGSWDFWVLKLDANGEIDPSCTFISDTFVTGVNSSATVTTTGVSGVISAATITVTTVTGVDSAATVDEQCYGCTDDAYEPDNSCIASETVIHDTETQTHNFCYDTEDWIVFNACTGRSYTIETSNLGLLADTVLELYDTDCATLLASDDNGGSGNASLINWTAPADGTYHLKVLQFDATTGKDRSYDLTLTGDTSPCATWVRTYGGASTDYADSIQPTSDGGFIVAGRTNSFGAGSYDFWVLKLDASGNIEWQKTYGGGGGDYAYSIQQTSDGGYIVAGLTYSFGAGSFDFWVLKLDASGSVQWQKTYGGASSDLAYSIQQTADGGFVVAGYTSSFGAGGSDFWVLKLDTSGNVSWQKTYGGASTDVAESVQQTSDGGFVVAGAGSYDFWVLKLDASGSVTWQKTYGGTNTDVAESVQQTSDGGFIVAGRTNSFGAGGRDFWVLKLDASGNVAWQKTYGGANDEAFASFVSVQQTTDGGFVVAGQTQSFGAGGNDFWVLKLDASGNVTWQKTYGGTNVDTANSIQQTTDGGFVVAGATNSFGAGNEDFWVLKMDANGDIDSSCTFIADTSVTDVDTTATITYTTAPGVISAATITTTSVTGVDSAATAQEQCSNCPALSVSAVVDSATVCFGTMQTFTATEIGGKAPLTFEWDFSYEGPTFNVEGTGNPVSYAQLSPGSYTVRVRVTDSCAAGAQTAEADVPIPITVNALPAPTITPSGPTTFCDGGSVTLDAGVWTSYSWSTGATTQTINVTTGGSYTVTVTDGNGCSGTSAAKVVTVNPLPTPVITETCGNPNSTLNAGAGYGFYLWSTGAKSQTISEPCGTGADYTVTVQDGNECFGTSVPYTVCDCPGPLDELEMRVADLAGGSWLILVHDAAATQYNVYANPLSTFGAAGDEYGSPDGAVPPSACNVGFTPSGGTATVDYPGVFPDDSWIVITAATASAGSETTPGYDSAATERSTVGAWTMCGP